MFLDRITIYVKGGDGGAGCISFRREYKINKGGPSGGDGGDGGDIIVEAAKNVDNLAALAGHKHWRADSGRPGEGGYRHGRSAGDVIIRVPPGTIIRDAKLGHVIRDLANVGDRVIVAKGGKGGRGNDAFKTATNRAPREAEPGEKGEERKIALELKVIADVGVIGKPNAGKSTLLSRLSRAHPEIADYPFTTKYPNLGMVQVGEDHAFAMADIPGLIEGAHSGAGLGHEFLKHVERCRLLVHLVEPEPMDQTNPLENYRQIHEELRLYDPRLAERPEIIAVSKAELPLAQEVAEELRRELGLPVIVFSAVTGKGLPQLVSHIWEQLQVLEAPEPFISPLHRALPNDADSGEEATFGEEERRSFITFRPAGLEGDGFEKDGFDSDLNDDAPDDDGVPFEELLFEAIETVRDLQLVGDRDEDLEDEDEECGANEIEDDLEDDDDAADKPSVPRAPTEEPIEKDDSVD